MAFRFDRDQWRLDGLRVGAPGSQRLERHAPMESWSTYLPVERRGRSLAAPDPGPEASMSAAVVEIRPGPGMLEDFILLHEDGSEDALLRYAQRWGLLGLCAKHRVGFAHPVGADGARCRVPAPREPLAVWQTYSRVAGEVLMASAALQQGRAPDVSFFTSTFEGYDRLLRDESRLPPLLAFLVSTMFIEDGGASIALTWAAEPAFIITPGSLLGAIGVQLAFSVAKSEGLAICTSCGRPYAPKRRPQAGRRNYCPTCGIRAARRDAKRDWADKQRSGQ